MYNNGNSSKNVTGSSVVDGSLESADYADDGMSGDKIDGGTISNFASTGIDDNATGTKLTVSDSKTTFSGDIEVDNGAVSSVVSTGTAAGVVQISGNGTVVGTSSFDLIQNSSGSFVWARNSEPLMFATGGTERMRILSSGGITFNGDTAAANALDDYEEGTWDPEFDPASGAFGSISYNIQSGKYTKVGNMVHVQGEIRTSAITVGTASGDCRISGLPFTANARSTLAIGYVVSFAGDEPLACRVEISTDRFQLHSRGAVGGNSANTQISHLDTGSSKNWINFSGVYQVS